MTQTGTVAAPALLERERLLAVLRRRFEQRLVAIVAGAGFGKSTLIRQGFGENLAEPRGIDVCVECSPDDTHLHHFAARLGALLSIEGISSNDASATAQAVADAIALRSPLDVCLVIEDGHFLHGTPSWEVVRRVHDRLPPNGHLLVSTRTEPDLPFARLASRGEAVLIDESQLSFTDEECIAFGLQRGVDLSSDPIHWPALAELTVRGAGPKLRRSYLVEEIVATLGPEVRRLLGSVVIAEGADDALASILMDRPVNAAHELRGVPLVRIDDDGWVQPHDLWRQAVGDLLGAEDRATSQDRAARELARRGRHAQSLRLYRSTGNWSAAGRVALAALSVQPPSIDTVLLASLLGEVPAADRLHPGWQLVSALLTYERSLPAARSTLERLIDELEETELLSAEERANAQVAVHFHLGTIGRRMGDESVLHWISERLHPLAALRHPSAIALRADVQAVLAQIHGRCSEGIEALDLVDHESVPPELAVHLLMISGNLHLLDDRTDRAIALYREAGLKVRGPVRLLAEELHATALWAAGMLDEAIDAERRCLESAERLGLTSRVTQFQAMLSAMLAMSGRIDEARSVFDRLPMELGSKSADEETRTLSLLVLTILSLVEGNREQATVFAGRITLPDGHLQRAMFLPVATIAALLPNRADAWEAMPARLVRRAVGYGRAVGTDVLVTDDTDRTVAQRIRALVPDVLLRNGTPRGSQVAASVSPPIRLRLLGRIEISPLASPGPWRRARVRELLASIALTGPKSREQLAEMLWPEQPDGVGTRNLRVNLSYLADAVEPNRARGGPSSLIATQGQTLVLAQVGVWCDVAAFDDARRRARTAEQDNDPLGALEALSEAVDLWRGDVAADIEADWLDHLREQRRGQFVAAATRAGELALGQGAIDRSIVFAERVLADDPGHERAGRLRAACLLASGDRRAAVLAITACLAACDDLGVEPAAETVVLATRLGVR